MSAVIPSYPLRKGRVHEVCGPAAYSFALRAAQGARLRILWVRARWLGEQLNPLGFDGFDPARLLTAFTRGQDETLAVAEDALRDGSVGLIVAELDAPLGLTAGRRLQLAAQTGDTTGLCLISEGMGSNASETRWRCAPVFDGADSTLQRWDLIKNKSGTTGGWDVRWDAQTHRIAVVSASHQRESA